MDQRTSRGREDHFTNRSRIRPQFFVELGLAGRRELEWSKGEDLEMVSDERDLTQVASVLIAIELRLFEKETEKEDRDELNRGIRPRVD